MKRIIVASEPLIWCTWGQRGQKPNIFKFLHQPRQIEIYFITFLTKEAGNPLCYRYTVIRTCLIKTEHSTCLWSTKTTKHSKFSRKHKIKVGNLSAKTEIVKKYLPLNGHKAGNYAKNKHPNKYIYTTIGTGWITVQQQVKMQLFFQYNTWERQAFFSHTEH